MTATAAHAPELAAANGGYYRNGRAVSPSPATLDASGRARLWALSAELSGLA